MRIMLQPPCPIGVGSSSLSHSISFFSLSGQQLVLPQSLVFDAHAVRFLRRPADLGSLHEGSACAAFDNRFHSDPVRMNFFSGICVSKYNHEDRASSHSQRDPVSLLRVGVFRQAILDRETFLQGVRQSTPKAWRALPWRAVQAQLPHGSIPQREATPCVLQRTPDYEERSPSPTTIDWQHRHRQACLQTRIRGKRCPLDLCDAPYRIQEIGDVLAAPSLRPRPFL